ncbi:hypothetical protein [Paraburkholderia sediminicola]
MTQSLEQIHQELEQTPQPQLKVASLERVYAPGPFACDVSEADRRW